MYVGLGVTDCTFLYGQRVMPCSRHRCFSTVTQTPSCRREEKRSMEIDRLVDIVSFFLKTFIQHSGQQAIHKIFKCGQRSEESCEIEANTNTALSFESHRSSGKVQGKDY